ncbi:peptidylprolyl isomerase [Heliomicrobium modesticaldum]|nr:peptidylprolyl isomerase [Heliomicrobium modesticaldum]
MRNKAITTILCSMLLLTAPVSAVSANEVTISVNGVTVDFPDVKPYVNDDGRTMVPLRFISEQLGAQVRWNESEQMALIQYRGKTIAIPIGQPKAYINGVTATIDTTAVRQDGRVLVPLQLISAVYGAKAGWDGETNRVTLQVIPEKTVIAKNNKYDKPPAMTIDPGKEYHATVRTNAGDFTIKLRPQDAPRTVNNFLFLARERFYDGIRFHRIIGDFMIQTGDPLGKGTGGPGYRFADELPVKIPYGPGVVAMANAGPDTNGSQFFICTGDAAKNLNSNPNYTIFGEVIGGMDVVKRIADTPVEAGPGGEISQPLLDTVIYEVRVEEQ